MNNDLEFQELKDQLADLKKQLDKQVVIHTDALHRTLRRGANSLRNREIFSIVFSGVMSFVIPAMIYFSGVTSLPFIIFTFISFAFMTAYSIVGYVKLHINNVLDQDLVAAQNDLLRFKRYYNRTLLFIGFPFLTIWLGWYVYEIAKVMLGDFSQVSQSHLIGFLCGIAICLLISGTVGGLIGYFTFYRPQMRLASRMLAEIDEVTNLGNEQ